MSNMQPINLPPPAIGAADTAESLMLTRTPTTRRIENKPDTGVDVTLFSTRNEVEDDDEPVDYSGAHEKTNPREIALVKKLDWKIMVSLLNPIP